MEAFIWEKRRGRILWDSSGGGSQSPAVVSGGLSVGGAGHWQTAAGPVWLEGGEKTALLFVVCVGRCSIL